MNQLHKKIFWIFLISLISNIGCTEKKPVKHPDGFGFIFTKKGKYITPNYFLTKDHCKFYTRQGSMIDDNGNVYYIKNKILNDRCNNAPFVKESNIIWVKFK